MSDDHAKPTAAAEAAGEAAAAVVEHTEHVEANAQAAIEAAQRQADDAKKTADEIAQAALQTSLGQQLESTRQEFASWRTQHETRMQAELAKIPVLEQTAADLKAGLGMLLGALKPESQSASTPPISAPDQPLAHKGHEAKNPAENEVAQPSPQAPPASSARKRRLL